ncbi:hypothetical protein GGX14DRAFT_608858 [Mycena pura]|uniref:2',3'-cyclic-nucleotide 3'-phosphodiesterase n=1 Tax=Mycena pura TaxID=153505 RepID=A0AAD6XXK1_9AGAR|nr:hypothetical protein GGX14DRAFT_608858 [Mycena pura]
MGYALWLVPVERERRALARLMAFRPSYRRKTGSRSYPIFAPHITLVRFSGPSLPSLGHVVPPDATETPVSFETMRVGDNYLGALSITISKSRELMDLHDDIVNRLEAMYQIETKSRRFPHLSLFYVDEADERQRLGNELIQTGRVQRGANDEGLLLTYDPGDKTLKPMDGFTVGEIWLMDCTSRVVGDWEVKEKWILPSSERPPSRYGITPLPPPSRTKWWRNLFGKGWWRTAD